MIFSGDHPLCIFNIKHKITLYVTLNIINLVNSDRLRSNLNFKEPSYHTAQGSIILLILSKCFSLTLDEVVSLFIRSNDIYMIHALDSPYSLHLDLKWNLFRKNSCLFLHHYCSLFIDLEFRVHKCIWDLKIK